jgi:hypothetical protein
MPKDHPEEEEHEEVRDPVSFEYEGGREPDEEEDAADQEGNPRVGQRRAPPAGITGYARAGTTR